MSEVHKGLKTWSHLAGPRKRPSEYEIVSTNLLHWTFDRKLPFHPDPNLPMNRWYRKFVWDSPIQHENWDAFRDPSALTYRSYNAIQDRQESYVDGLLDEYDELGHDHTLNPDWMELLARLYTPSRYLFHAVQMSTGYLVQVAPASTIAICATFQMADALRWVSRIAYRTRELASHQPDHGFAADERVRWENEPAWQGFRELIERQLISYDWGEALISLNLVVKPAIDEVVIRGLASAAKSQGDTLLALLCDAQLKDSARSREWTSALVKFVLQKPGNRSAVRQWIEKWNPLADRAIETFSAALPASSEASANAKTGVRAYQRSVELAQ
jgi:toluene monooxygenase system protein E